MIAIAKTYSQQELTIILHVIVAILILYPLTHAVNKYKK